MRSVFRQCVKIKKRKLGCNCQLSTPKKRVKIDLADMNVE